MTPVLTFFFVCFMQRGSTSLEWSLFLLFRVFMKFSFQEMLPNLKAWFTVALVSVPMAISLSIVCGWTPLLWLLSWVWAGIMAAIFCSSPHNAYGPAWALAWILLPLSLEYGVQYFPLLALIAWIIMLLIWALRLSNYLSIIPWAALQWFLLWIALIIGIQQIPAILGISLDYTALEALTHIADVHWLSVWLFIVSLGTLQLWRRYFPKVPWIILVTLFGILIGRFDAFTSDLWIQVLVDRYGQIAFSLFQTQNWSSYLDLLSTPVLFKQLLIAGIWIAVIALLETLISAKIATKTTRVWFISQREVYWLWLTNIVTWLVWWMPVSALVPRTTLNIQQWATNKWSWAFIWIFTGLFAAFLFSWGLQYLPFAVIAGILVDIALGMFNISLYHKLWQSEKSSIVIIWLVWAVSYLRDPMLGILLWTSSALLLMVMRAMKRDLITNVFRDGHHVKKTSLVSYISDQHSDDILLIKLEGELNYLNTETHTNLLRKVHEPTTVILGFWYTCVMDNDAAEELDVIIQQYLQQGKQVYITWLEDQNLALMKHESSYHVLLEQWHIFESKSRLLEQLLEK